MRRPGMTLVEVLIAAGLLSVLLTLAVTLLWGTMPAWRQAEKQRIAFQGAVTVLDELSHVLRQARRIDVPTWSQLDAGYAPIVGKNQPLIISLPDSLTALAWDGASGEAVETKLSHIPAPDELLPQPARRVGPGGTFTLQRAVRSGIGLLRIRVTCRASHLLPVETEIRLDPRTLQETGP